MKRLKHAHTAAELEWQSSSDSEPMHVLTHDFQASARSQIIQIAQSRHTPLERRLSNIFHKPFLDTLSSVWSRTITRPYCVLVSGLCGLVGTGASLWLCNHYGFAFNPLLVIIFLTTGYLLGLALELVFKLRRS
jgi:hypothetical protein